MSFKLRIIVLSIAAFLFIPTPRILAQATTAGSLVGTVTDPSGSVIPNATLTLLQPATGTTTRQTTNSEGGYIFPNLQAGAYRLTVNAQGFAEGVYNNVVISIGHGSNLNVAMKVGGTNQEVQVSANSQLLETTTNTLSTTIAPDAVQDLPLNGRDALPFAQLTPGAQIGGDQRFTTFNALPNAALNISVDGMNDNFQRYRTSTTGFYSAAPLRLGAIEEVSVATNNLTADAGAEGSVTLRFQIKRGTNKYHGNLFWQHQNSALNANTYANNAIGQKKQPYHLNDFGGSVGGPVWPNKLFFFFNYEQEYVPATQKGIANVLTPDAQNGIFTYTNTSGTATTVNLFQIAKNNGFPSTTNSMIAAELAQINKASASTNLQPTTLPYQLQSIWSYSNTTKNIYPTLRVDYQIKPNIDFHAAYNMYWRDIPGTEIYQGDPNVNNSFRSTYSTLTAGLDWTITQHLVNQVNFGLLNTQEEFNVGNSFNPFTSTNNIVYTPPTFVNGAASLAPYVPNYILPEPRNNPIRDIFDNLTWTRGKHSFTFGGDFRSSTSFDTGTNSPAPNILGLDPQDPANSMFTAANFPGLDFNQSNHQDLLNAESLYATLVGRVSSINGSNYVDTASHQFKPLGAFKEVEAQKVGGFYFQDAWRPTPHLAVNYGMRWQFSGAIHNTNNTYTNPSLADLIGPSTREFHPGELNGIANPQIQLNPSPYSADLKQPAPNLGFAWNPSFDNGNLVIRGGGAISHYDEGWGPFEQATVFTNPGTQQKEFLNAGPPTNTPAGQFPAGSLSLGMVPGTGNIPPTNKFPATFSFPIPQSDFTFGGQPLATVDPNLRSPYIESWYVGVQQKIPWNFVVEANYVGNHATHMWSLYDLNEVNIFENGFVQEFQRAQANLAANGGPNAANPSFAGANLPLLTQAFGAGGSGFTNSTYVNYVSTGQAAALANAIAGNSTYFCNLVGGAGFSPCSALGYAGSTQYPINIFQQNPFATAAPTQLLSDPGSSSYNGLQMQVKHTASNLTLMANYAYSHAFTNRYIGDYYTADAAVANFRTLRDRQISRAPSPYDLRHTFKAYALYALPFKVSNHLLGEVVEGWKIGTIFGWQKGRNFKLLGGTYTYNYFSNLTGQPDSSDSGVVLNGTSIHQLQKSVGYYPGPNNLTPRLLMDPKVFSSGQVTSESTPGQLGQSIYLTGPQFVNTDLSISKDFPIHESLKLQFQAEILNLFNHPAWSVVDGYSGGTNNPAQYVTLTNNPVVPGSQTNPEGLQSGGSRDIQFRLQLVF